MVDRVPTLLTFNTTLNNMRKNMTNLAEVQNQISSGVKVDTFAELSADGNVRRVLSVDSQISKANSYIFNNETVLLRLNTTDKTLSRAEDLVEEMLKVLVIERSANQDLNPLGPLARNSLDSLETLLNTEIGGRFIYSGTRTDKKAVGDLNNSNIIDSAPSSNYYEGDAGNSSVKINDELSLTYNVRADDPAFQKMIAALHFAINSEDQTNVSGQNTNLTTAINLMNEVKNELAAIRNKVNTDIVTIKDVNTQHERFKTYFNQVLSDTVGTDVAEASIKVSLDQTILQASFQAFSRISSLKLSDYL